MAVTFKLECLPLPHRAVQKVCYEEIVPLISDRLQDTCPRLVSNRCGEAEVSDQSHRRHL